MPRLIDRLFGRSPKNHLELVDPPSPGEVEDYYDSETASYVNSYGDIIQAARPKSDVEFLEYLLASIGIEDGMRMVDAGCGVCGPAAFFAQKRDVLIDAITNSSKQVEACRDRISELELGDRLKVTKGDFHRLCSYYDQESYDLIYFLESLGYSADLLLVLREAFKLLKPGGRLYVKDFFPVPLTDSTRLDRQLEITKAIRKEYRYRLLDLVNLISLSRELGFFLVFVRRFDFEEDFTNASEFEHRNRYSSYTSAITNPYQLYEPLELMFEKPGT